MNGKMVDPLGRNIDYLRISVTDRCNMRCVYCMPPEGVESLPCQEILRYEEIIEVVRAAKELGISHIRITGGEPLVRKGITKLIKAIKDTGITDISMTTNGALLPRYATALKSAGLNRVNISLDSLDPDVFRKMTRIGDLGAVLEGMQTAVEAGLSPVKVNVVVMKNVNAGEVQEMAKLTLTSPLHVRFIEVMPVGLDPENNKTVFVPLDEVKAKIEKIGPLKSVRRPQGAGPAVTFKLPGSLGTVGFIAALSHPFCKGCNRLRLTADGKLRPCLASDYEIDLKRILRDKTDEADQDGAGVPTRLREAFLDAVRNKPTGHGFWAHQKNARRMCQIGG